MRERVRGTERARKREGGRWGERGREVSENDRRERERDRERERESSGEPALRQGLRALGLDIPPFIVRQ